MKDKLNIKVGEEGFMNNVLSANWRTCLWVV
jgi:hypothetical protein